MQLIDSHCHLDDARFDSDRAEVIKRAREVGIDHFVVPAVSRDGWSNLSSLAGQFPSIHPAFGLHPWFCDRHDASDLQLLPEFLEGAVAVGECGLDSGLCKFKLDDQLCWLRPQLRFAADGDLPVILHAYGAVDAVIHEIRQFPGLRGVVHSFSGSLQQAGQLVDLGFYLGLGGAVTNKRAIRLQAVVRELPVERLLIETDAPDQPPAGHRGMRNEPAFLIEILAAIATLREVEGQELILTLNDNARELFSI